LSCKQQENKRSPGGQPELSDTTSTPPELSERGIHSAGGGVSHVGEHVRVDIQGKAYVGMA
jgi:hypothetical protein